MQVHLWEIVIQSECRVLFQRTCSFLILTFFFLESSVRAETLVTVTFEGTVTARGDVGGIIGINDPLSGIFVFDSDIVPTGNATDAMYDSLKSLDFTIGAHTFSSTTASGSRVKNNFDSSNEDFFDVAVTTGISDDLDPPLQDVTLLQFEFSDSTATAFSDATDMSSIIPALQFANFDSATFDMTLTTTEPDDFPFVSGTMTALSAISEPSGLLLLCVATTGVVAAGRPAAKSLPGTASLLHTVGTVPAQLTAAA